MIDLFTDLDEAEVNDLEVVVKLRVKNNGCYSSSNN